VSHGLFLLDDGWMAEPIYTNSADISTSQWDLLIDFSLATRTPDSPEDDPRYSADTVALIVTSPTHAKVLASLLAEAIRKWEGKYGELPAVESLMPPQPAGDT
jgi:Protein of unknown function (DUF3467)